MAYYTDLDERFLEVKDWLDLKKEHGADSDAAAEELRGLLAQFAKKIEKLPVDKALQEKEPDDLDAIRALRPDGPRVLEMNFSDEELEDRILGAWLGRAAGCMLGVPVEGFTREGIESACHALEVPYPIYDYWERLPRVVEFHNTYNGLPFTRFLKPYMEYAMPDDDMLYTLVGLVILEEYGLDFTIEDVGKAWLKYVPFGCTAEKVAIKHLKAGMIPPETALVNNPDSEYLGADIRSDPWGYAAPGMPELAATYAYRDARVSHIRNGIYGEMFFSAVISAAIATGDINKSIEIGLTEIPAECRLAEGIRQTLDWCSETHDYNKILDKIFDRYRGMHCGHTINNAALVVAGLICGHEDFSTIITSVVMAGMDTDCTGATAGSIAGAIWGAKKLPKRWIEPMGSIHRSYMPDRWIWDNNDIARRFTKLALANRDRTV